MFFRRKKRDDEDESQFSKLDELVASESNPVADGIRRALQRDDLTPEDRAEFEAALQRITQGTVDPS
jgi:hypothetical protein